MEKRDSKGFNKTYIILILTILIIFSISVTKKGKILVVEDRANQIHKEFYLKDNSFILSYTHSVHKTVFEEYFIVTDDNKLLLQKNIFDSFGVGSPYIENINDVKIENDKFVLQLNRFFNEVNMVISPIPKHKLTIGDREIMILDLLDVKTNSIKIYPLEKYVIAIGHKYVILW